MEKAEIRSEIQPAELERPVKSGSSKKRKRKKYLFVYLMLVPAIINFAIFYVGVNLNSFIMAFRQPVEMGENGFIYQFSLINFRKIFTALTTPLDELHVGFFNTLKYFASALLITLPLSYLTSYFLYKKMWGYKFFRIVFFLPSIIPAIVYVTVFQNMLNVSGPVGVLYQAIFGEQIPPLLTTASTATNCIIFFTIWTGFGVNMLLYQGAMSRLPEEVLEAGKLDGVGWLREMFQIVTPMIWPTLSMTIILVLSKVFMATGPILLFNDTGTGAPYNMSTISYFIFSQTYGGAYSLEYPAAISVFFTIVSLPIVLFVRWFFSKIDPEVSY